MLDWIKRTSLTPAQQLLYGTLFLCAVFVLWGSLLLFSSVKQSRALHSSVLAVQQQLQYVKRQNASQIATRNSFNQANAFYLHETLEAILLLPSASSLSSSSKENFLVFTETNMRKNGFLQETNEKLSYPVSVDLNDVKKLLTYIEGLSHPPFTPPKDRTHLIALDFFMQKNFSPAQGEHYTLDMKLLQRLYL